MYAKGETNRRLQGLEYKRDGGCEKYDEISMQVTTTLLCACLMMMKRQLLYVLAEVEPRSVKNSDSVSDEQGG